MEKFTALAAAGVAEAAIFALVAIGFLLVYKATGVINFAQGDLVTLGAFLAVAASDWGWGLGLAYVFSLVAMFFVGVAFERVGHAPLRGRNMHVHLIATFGVGLAIRALLNMWQGAAPRRLDSPVAGGTVKLFGGVIAEQRVLIIIVAVLTVGLVIALLYRTAFGRQVRALASDREAAQLQGVAVSRVSALTFGLSAVLAGLAGILIGPLTAVDLNLGFVPMLSAFAAAIVGGFGRLGGMLVGALVIGLSEQLVGGYVFPSYRDAYPYIVMLAIVMIRPAGLFGTEVGERV